MPSRLPGRAVSYYVQNRTIEQYFLFFEAARLGPVRQEVVGGILHMQVEKYNKNCQIPLYREVATIIVLCINLANKHPP